MILETLPANDVTMTGSSKIQTGNDGTITGNSKSLTGNGKFLTGNGKMLPGKAKFLSGNGKMFTGNSYELNIIQGRSAVQTSGNFFSERSTLT